jgi:hypothetical protein
MRRKFSSIIYVLMISLNSIPAAARAQACCSAGTPLLSSLELPSTAAGSLQFALTYEHNVLRDVMTGSESLDDDSRRRTTQSVLFETSYGLSSSFSASALFTLVRQERWVRSSFDRNESLLTTQGAGDAAILLKYSIVKADIIRQLDISIGAGAKMPLGPSALTFEGILLPADMQPGTGAWDGILWTYASQGFVPVMPLNVFATASYRFTGTNSRYGEREDGYAFGNEFVASVGAGYRTDMVVDFSFAVRFRHVKADRFSESPIPNTGGIWFLAVPGINVKLLHNLTIRASGQIPLYRRLSGTQLTTSHTASVSVFFSISSVSD